jgi:hypothetical protein
VEHERKGKRLLVTVEPLRESQAKWVRDQIGAEAQRLAALDGGALRSSAPADPSEKAQTLLDL